MILKRLRKKQHKSEEWAKFKNIFEVAKCLNSHKRGPPYKD